MFYEQNKNQSCTFALHANFFFFAISSLQSQFKLKYLKYKQVIPIRFPNI